MFAYALFTYSAFGVKIFLQIDVSREPAWKFGVSGLRLYQIFHCFKFPLNDITLPCSILCLTIILLLRLGYKQIQNKMKTKGTFLRSSFETENYWVRLMLCFFAPISGKERRLNYTVTAQEVSWVWKKKEGQGKDRKRDRQKKQMTDNVIFAGLTGTKIQSLQNPSFA